MIEVISNQPDDSSFDEILRELFCAGEIHLGLVDSAEGKIVQRGCPQKDGFMAQVTWTQRALSRREAINDSISRNDPVAADRVVEAIFQRTERLKSFPRIGQ
jgi:hypothetical protein